MPLFTGEPPSLAVLSSSPEAASFAVPSQSTAPSVTVTSGAQPAAVPVPIITAQQGPAGPEGATGAAGPQGPPAGQLTYTASVTLSGHRALMVQPDGTVIPADPNAPGYIFAGISLGAAQAGASVTVEDDGVIVEPSWAWTSGSPVFALAGGLLTQTAPTSGVVHLIGFAVNPTTLRVAPQPPIQII